MSKVPHQKGSIDANPMTQRQQTNPDRIKQAFEDKAMIRRNQTLDLHEPKSGKR